MNETKKAYTQFSQTPGYGHRIFIPYEHVEEVTEVLKPFCMWGGPDKDTGLAKGWEFSKDGSYSLAKIQLFDKGFSVEPLSDLNHTEVWP